jgi:hypothetical protein
VTVSFIGGGNWSTQRKPPTCRKSLTNFITLYYIEYTSPLAQFEFITLVVIGTDRTISYKSNYRSEIQITSTSFNLFQFENGAFSKINKLVLVICISERQIERRGSGTSSVG